MTDKVNQAIYIYDSEKDKVKTIQLKTFLCRVNNYSKDSVYSSNSNKIYFALKPDALEFRKEYNKQLINT